VADVGPIALEADELLWREVIGDGLEEPIRHARTGHGANLMPEGSVGAC
jgi:hypothetical protein